MRREYFPPSRAKRVSVAIGLFTVMAMCLNVLGINLMKALVWSSVAQGISTPFLMLVIMLITNNRRIMGRWVNTRLLNVIGWITTAAIFAAAMGLFITWVM